MAHTYPYPSKNKKAHKKLRKGQDYTDWTKPGLDIPSAIHGLRGPIVEIGGPTESGFYFLDKSELPSEVLITNIDDVAGLVRMTVDGTNMPFKNDSTGLFLMSGMSIASDWYVRLPEAEKERKSSQIKKEFDVARLEMEQVAIGILDPSLVQYAQRVPIYFEMYRSLVHGGLVMTDGSLTEIKILQRLGFEIIAFTQELIRPEHNWDGIFYEVVAQKL